MNKKIALLLLPLLKLRFFRLHLGLFHYLFYNKNLTEQKGVYVRDGLKLSLDTKNLIDARIFFTGSYEPELRAVFRKLIHKDDVILDIGANIGYHSLLFSEACGPEGKVYSFEPVKKNYAQLIKNIALNKIKNINPLNFALGNSDINLVIDIEESGPNPGSISLLNVSKTGEEISCRDADKALLAMNIKKIDFIKIDVEGYEWFVLESLKNIIKETRPIIIFEWDSNYQANSNINASDFHAYFSSLNYELFHTENKLNLKVDDLNAIKSANILAKPIENNFSI